ncbi:MAG: uracil-DNA glycosylase [Clostridia bacterium]|nr:uracil-DNA glycosylase [Oscillospiraceae bacterium]MBQ6701777.1 uracil-DNA glycosylase [Clostridia bacterium]
MDGKQEELDRKWSELEETCKNCRKCPLCETRTNVVFGSGNRSADLMFIGEAPGEKEDLSGIPFVGAAGKLLDKFLYAVDIDRERVFIANMLKCRPPKNRDPKEEEQDLCIDYLREQVRLIKPKIIVCLGRIAAKRLIKEDFMITKEHGIFFEKNGFTICAVFHPAALLRDPRRKEDMLVDMKKIKKKLDEV